MKATSVSDPTKFSSVTINITPPPLAVLTSSFPDGEVGAFYNQVPVAIFGTTPYTWSISAGTLPLGLSINSTTGAITGAPTAAGVSSFTLEVTDAAATTATANLSITIQPKLAITSSGALPAGSVGRVYAQPLTTIGGVPNYTFALANGTSLPAALTVNENSGDIAGVPSAIGTFNFVVVVTDSLGSTSSANLGLNITAQNCPNNSNFQGNYAFHVNSGFGLPGSELIGSFVADGAGNIGQGFVDNGYNSTASLTGTYCIAANNSGTVTLLASLGSNPPLNSPFLIEIDSSGNGIAIDYENPSQSVAQFSSGAFLKQDTTAFSTAKIVGNYAFGFPAEAGTFLADGAGNLTSGECDLQIKGGPNPLTYTVMFSAADLSVAPTGRGTATLDLSDGVTIPLIFYVVNSAKLFALIQAVPPSSAVAATEIVQSTGSPYSNSSLNGVSVVGLQSFGGNSAQVGLITWDGSGKFTLSTDQNDFGVLSSPGYGGTYSVAPNGRVTLTSSGQSAPILYLSGPNQGFVVGTDITATAGQIVNQSGSPFSDTSFSGSYLGWSWQPIDSSVDFELDAFTADGAGNLTGTSYLNGYLLGPSSTAVSATYTVSSAGRGVVTKNGATTGIFYVVSPTQVLLLQGTGVPEPKLVTLSHP